MEELNLEQQPNAVKHDKIASHCLAITRFRVGSMCKPISHIGNRVRKFTSFTQISASIFLMETSELL